MPKGDGRGPAGKGPQTGQGEGLCSGGSAPGFIKRVLGKRLGRGRNARPGRAMREQAPGGDDAGLNSLDQMRSLREGLASIEKKVKGKQGD